MANIAYQYRLYPDLEQAALFCPNLRMLSEGLEPDAL